MNIVHIVNKGAQTLFFLVGYFTLCFFISVAVLYAAYGYTGSFEFANAISKQFLWAPILFPPCWWVAQSFIDRADKWYGNFKIRRAAVAEGRVHS